MQADEDYLPHPALAHDISFGLPPEFADEIVKDNLGPPLSWLGAWIFMFVMIGGFAILWLILWPALENYDNQKALKSAIDLDGLAYYTNFGLGLIIVLFAWIVATATSIALTIRLSPKRIKATLYLASRNDFIGKTPRLFGLHKVWKNASGFKTAEDYLNAIAMRMFLWTGRVVLVLMAVAFYLLWCETTWHEVYTGDAYVEFSFWTNTKSIYPWSEVTSVELGCNQIEDSSHLLYEIHWIDGSKTRFPNYDNDFPPNKNWIVSLETVDSKISKSNAEFKRWNWLKRDPLHPNCLSFFENRLNGDEFTRFKAILRMDTLDL